MNPDCGNDCRAAELLRTALYLICCLKALLKDSRFITNNVRHAQSGLGTPMLIGSHYLKGKLRFFRGMSVSGRPAKP
jgi:hypothetical protein